MKTTNVVRSHFVTFDHDGGLHSEAALLLDVISGWLGGWMYGRVDVRAVAVIKACRMHPGCCEGGVYGKALGDAFVGVRVCVF